MALRKGIQLLTYSSGTGMETGFRSGNSPLTEIWLLQLESVATFTYADDVLVTVEPEIL